ncbi:MAG: PTS sugar transporter subunit IIC [Gemmatimonadota bacterium]|nr:PTS sugar transporter subunit IIC [Gemmatimonadota bacterium]
MTGVASFVLLVVVGALCSLDTVSVAQAMVSRPIVSATLGAAALGRPWEGLVVGAVLELFALETLPFGASRYPEWGSAGVVAGATFVAGGIDVPGSLALAILAGLGTAWIGSTSMVWHRKLVAKVAGDLRDDLAAGSAAAVTRLHITGIASDLWRGGVVTATGLVAAVAVTSHILEAWRLAYGPSVAVPVIVAVAVGMSATFRAAKGTRGAGWFLLAGAAAGAGVLGVRP